MKSYRRILVPIAHNGHSDSLLHTLKETVSNHHPQVLVVRLLDTQVIFEPDGPAATWAEEAVAHRIPEVMRQLELQLARMNLAWVEARAIKGSPPARLRELVDTWQPDLLITNPALLPAGLPAELDILSTSGRSVWRRLLDNLSSPLPGHA